MKIRIASAACCAAILLALGCGGAKTGGVVQVAAGPMPEGGNWDGVYQSPGYGRMEFTVQGANVAGLYEGERHYGKIEGTINGDVMEFTWTQWKQDLQGKERVRSGHGYFRYIIEQDKGATTTKFVHRIEGEWGYEQDNAGNPWKAVKLNERTKKQLKPRDAAAEGDEEDLGQSAGFDESKETAVEMDEGAPPEEKEPTIQKDKPAEGLDNLF